MIHANISSWITRTEVQRRLGVTRARVEELVKKGDLNPRCDFQGHKRFDPSEVELLRTAIDGPRHERRAGKRLDAGSVAARAFRMLGEGKSLRDIVIALEITPERATELRRRWAEVGGELVLSARAVLELRDRIEWRGDERTLVEAVELALRREFQRGVRARVKEDEQSHDAA